jgi:hypothetical protein
LCTQFGSQLHMIKNFPVLHHGNLPVIAEEGLMSPL